MLGENRRSERMFYYVRMEDIVPENHLLRLIDRHIDLKFQKRKMGILYDRVMGRHEQTSFLIYNTYKDIRVVCIKG